MGMIHTFLGKMLQEHVAVMNGTVHMITSHCKPPKALVYSAMAPCSAYVLLNRIIKGIIAFETDT